MRHPTEAGGSLFSLPSPPRCPGSTTQRLAPWPGHPSTTLPKMATLCINHHLGEPEEHWLQRSRGECQRRESRALSAARPRPDCHRGRAGPRRTAQEAAGPRYDHAQSKNRRHGETSALPPKRLCGVSAEDAHELHHTSVANVIIMSLQCSPANGRHGPEREGGREASVGVSMGVSLL